MSDDIEVEVTEHRAHRDTCVVDKYIDTSELIDGLLHQILAVVFHRHISLDAQDVIRVRHCSLHLIEFIGGACCDDHFRIHRGEQSGSGQPDSRAGASYDYYLIFKIFISHIKGLPSVASQDYRTYLRRGSL